MTTSPSKIASLKIELYNTIVARISVPERKFVSEVSGFPFEYNDKTGEISVGSFSDISTNTLHTIVKEVRKEVNEMIDNERAEINVNADTIYYPPKYITEDDADTAYALKSEFMIKAILTNLTAVYTGALPPFGVVSDVQFGYVKVDDNPGLTIDTKNTADDLFKSGDSRFEAMLGECVHLVNIATNVDPAANRSCKEGVVVILDDVIFNIDKCESNLVQQSRSENQTDLTDSWKHGDRTTELLSEIISEGADDRYDLDVSFCDHIDGIKEGVTLSSNVGKSQDIKMFGTLVDGIFEYTIYDMNKRVPLHVYSVAVFDKLSRACQYQIQISPFNIRSAIDSELLCDSVAQLNRKVHRAPLVKIIESLLTVNEDTVTPHVVGDFKIEVTNNIVYCSSTVYGNEAMCSNLLHGLIEARMLAELVLGHEIKFYFNTQVVPNTRYHSTNILEELLGDGGVSWETPDSAVAWVMRNTSCKITNEVVLIEDENEG